MDNFWAGFFCSMFIWMTINFVANSILIAWAFTWRNEE